MADRILIPDHTLLFWAGLEASFGAGPAAAPAATDAIRHISADLPLMRTRDVRVEDATGNRGSLPNIQGAVDPVALRILCPLRGAGTPTAKGPEFSPFLKAGGFAETVAANVATYIRSLTSTASTWLWGATSDGTVGQAYSGGVTTEIGLPDVGTNQARIEFAQQAARGATVYACKLAGPATAVATSLTLPATHGWVINGAPAWIQVTSADASKTEIMKVTAVVGTTATVVRAQGGTTAQTFALNDTIAAHVPARTLVNVPPIGEVGGGFQVDDGGGLVGRQFTKAGVVIQTGIDLLEKLALEIYRDGLSVGKYGDNASRLTADVTYTIGADGIAYLHRHADAKTLIAIAMAIGTVAGNRCTVTLPTAQIEELNAPFAADGPRKGTIIFAGKSTDGGDITLKFD